MRRFSMQRCAIVLTFVAVLASACGSDTTTGREIVLQTKLEADSEIEAPFETKTGWTVTLTKAVISGGPLYYFDGEPAFVRNEGPSWLERIASWFGTSTAHAHPGHYVAGMALGQMTTPFLADLLSGPVALAEGNGITGQYRSARFSFAAPSGGALADDLGPAVAIVEGAAVKGEQTVHFKLSADFADVSRSVSDGHVEGCGFDETEVTSDGTVTVHVVPHVWFSLVDFTEVASGSPEAPTEVAKGETAQIAFALGLVQLSAYRFSFSE
jgi:hypothetical protein